METNGVFSFKIISDVLLLTPSASFEYPCYWSTAMRNIVILSVRREPSSKVIYHPLCSMNKFVTNKSKLPQDGAQVFPYMG